jgi:micrococcal nuclease
VADTTGVIHHNQPSRRSFVRGLGLIAYGALGGVAGCTPPSDLAAGESGRIARVSDGDALALDSGLKVRLVEVEAPAPGWDKRPDEPYAPEAADLLSVAALGRNARLYYGGLSRDRYDRALAHVIASDETGADIWLNGLMTRQGGARVRTFPDNARRVRRLYAMEDEARRARRGLWALDHWRVRGPDDLVGAPYFAVVEAALLSVDSTPGDGAVHITPRGLVLATGDGLGESDAALDLRIGKALRVRGRIDARGDEPLIRLTHWAQLETPRA